MSSLACPRCSASLVVAATRDSHVTVACKGCRSNVVISERSAAAAPSASQAPQTPNVTQAHSLRLGGLLLLLSAIAAGVIAGKLA